MAEFTPIHPDAILGPEAAMEVAGEMVWLSRIRALREMKQDWLADKIFTEQYRRDEDGMIYVEVQGERWDLGHVSTGFNKLTELLNKSSG